MSYSLTNFNTPLEQHIPGGVKEGKQFIISGYAQPGCETFSINFQTEPYSGCDVAFHLNPRIPDAVVVRNSYIGDWGDEERDADYFPFFEGQRFTLRIVVEDYAFRVYVNGSHFLDYSHRMSYQDVRYLVISDGVELYEVTMRDSLQIPYTGEIDGHLNFGKAIEIKGSPTFDNDRFSINICEYPDEMIGLHLNPRPDQNSVVLNHYDGSWGEEQVVEFNPFQPWTMFNIMIIATEEGFRIFLNDTYFALFPYRCSVHDMKYIHIKGSVSIASIEFLEPLPQNFTKEIPSGLEYKDIIKVKGFFPFGDVFSINLKCGDDIPFHFNPRRSEGEVVMNCLLDGEWGTEEREPLPYTFMELVPFEVKMKVKESKLKVYVNDKSLAKYRPSRDISRICDIGIAGEVFIYQIKLLRRMDVPYVERLPGTLAPGRWIKVAGSMRKNAERFAINLKCEDDILLHFNPRLGQQEVVRNTCIGGEWGEEETGSDSFPFAASEPFEIFIAIQEETFKIFINGNYFVDFAHRMPFECAKSLELTEGAHFFEPEFY